MTLYIDMVVNFIRSVLYRPITWIVASALVWLAIFRVLSTIL